jgi:aminoglycoside 3-N-acetyltransferase
LKSYSLLELQNALRSLNLSKGDVVLVQAALFDLGIIENVAPSEIAANFYDGIRTAIGTEGTICAATFTLETTRGIPYESAANRTHNGSLAEYIRRLPETRRSRHPMQSVAAAGPAAEIITSDDSASGYAPEGPFGRLVAMNAKVLLVGRTNVQLASLGHYAEEQAQVPYRYWKEFSVACVTADGCFPRNYKMYVRDEALGVDVDFVPFSERLIETGVLVRRSLGGSDIRLGYVAEVVSTALAELNRDPWFFCNARSLMMKSYDDVPMRESLRRRLLSALIALRPDQEPLISQLRGDEDLFGTGLLDSIGMLELALILEELRGGELQLAALSPPLSLDSLIQLGTP